MSTLKAKYPTHEDIPEAYRDLFEERQGEWILIRIEGLVSEGDVHRVQETNRKLREENAALKKHVDAYGEKTPDDIQDLLHENEELKAQVESGDGKLDESKIQSLVEARVKKTVGPIERERDKWKTDAEAEKRRADELEGRYLNGIVTDAVRAAATKAEVIPSAIEDILLNAERLFEVVETNGKHKVVTKDQVGVTPGMDPETWLAVIQEHRSHWWPRSTGGGAGGGKHDHANGKNPWAKEHWNMMEQGKIYRDNPVRAKELAKQAGASPPTE